MGARNESQGRRWARRLLVVCLAAIVVQVLGWLLLDGVVEATLVLAPWLLVTAGMTLTMPVKRPGLPAPQPSLAQGFAPTFPSVVFFVPMLWLGRQQDGGWQSWAIVALGLLCAVAVVALTFRARRVRRGPVPLVPLRRTDQAS